MTAAVFLAEAQMILNVYLVVALSNRLLHQDMVVLFLMKSLFITDRA